MTLLLLLVVVAALVAVLARAGGKGYKNDSPSFPVTIIRDQDRLSDKQRMTVAITGALSEPRAQIAIKINSTRNARFVERVFLDTDYLVATRVDTAKARTAAQNGTVILSEQQLAQYLSAGEFPHHQRRHTHSSFNFDESEIQWEDTCDPPIRYRLAYADSEGEYSERIIEVTHLAGKHPNGHEYLAAFDEGELKTFRKDRILELERV